MKKVIAFALITMISLSSIALAKGPQRGRGGASTTLNATEIADAQYMREEEKLARDVYRVMFAYWGNPVFSNISSAEQSHMDAMEDLLQRKGIEDPVAPDAVTGEFVDEELGHTYDELLDRGAESEEQAIRVGLSIEESDMTDIQMAIDNTDDRDIQRVYESLLKGSQNHLRAYVRQLEKMGFEYIPELISVEEADEILGSR